MAVLHYKPHRGCLVQTCRGCVASVLMMFFAESDMARVANTNQIAPGARKTKRERCVCDELTGDGWSLSLTPEQLR